jgi:hypothetical protein
MLHTDGDILRLQSANRQFKYTPAKQLLQGLVCLLLLHKPTSAEQEWYEYDDSIINGSVSCYFMEMDHQQGRLCTATQILFDRSEQELGQIHDMLVCCECL